MTQPLKRPAKPWIQPHIPRHLPPIVDAETQLGQAWEQVPDDINAYSLGTAVMALRMQRDFERRSAERWRELATDLAFR